MTDDRNLPKIAEDAAVAALDEATRKKPRGEITHAIIADASGMRPMTQAEIAGMAERDAEYDRMQERAVAQTGFPWNAGSRAAILPDYVVIATRGDEARVLKFCDTLDQTGWGATGDDTRGWTIVVARIDRERTAKIAQWREEARK